MIQCPYGKHPLTKKYDEKKGRAVFAGSACVNCLMLKQCSASKQGNNYVIFYDARNLRLRERRLYEKTNEFREKYRKRSRIEGLFGRLKQYTPLRRLRVRGKLAVFNSIYSIMTGHNIMQMAKFYKMKPAQEQKNAIASAKIPFPARFLSFQWTPMPLEELITA